jgi:hypothetical protein
VEEERVVVAVLTVVGVVAEKCATTAAIQLKSSVLAEYTTRKTAARSGLKYD